MARSSFLYNFYRTRLILYKKGFELFRNYKRGLRVGCPKKKTLLSIRPSVLSCLLIHFFFSSYFTLYFVNFSNSFTTNTSGPLRVITRSLPNKSWTWALYSWLQAMPYGVTACSCWFGGDVKASGTEIRWLKAALIFIEALPDGSHTLNDRCITAFNVTRWCV